MKILVFLCVLVYSFQNSVNCQGGSSGNGLLTLNDIDGTILQMVAARRQVLKPHLFLSRLSFSKLFTFGLKKTFFGKKIEAPHCQDKLVCQVDCRDFFPNCKNYKQYMETIPTSDAEDQNVYSQVCVQRWYEDPNQSDYFQNVVLPTLKSWNKDFGVSGFKTYQQFEDEVNKAFLGKPGYNALMTFINYSKLYRSFQKLCQMNPDWAQQIDSKIIQFESNPIPNEPVGINDIRQKAKDFEAKFNAEVAPVANSGGFFGFISTITDNIKTAQKNKFLQIRDSMRTL